MVAVKLVRPLFKYGVALCAGLTGGMFTYELLSGLSDLTLMGWILFWGLAGYFAAEMLLRKSFRCWRPEGRGPSGCRHCAPLPQRPLRLVRL